MSKKIINQADDVVSEMMEGFVAAYDRYYEKVGDVNGILYKNHRKNQVGLVIGGGSGHDPMFAGLWAGDWLTRLLRQCVCFPGPGNHHGGGPGCQWRPGRPFHLRQLCGRQPEL